MKTKAVSIKDKINKVSSVENFLKIWHLIYILNFYL